MTVEKFSELSIFKRKNFAKDYIFSGEKILKISLKELKFFLKGSRIRHQIFYINVFMWDVKHEKKIHKQIYQDVSYYKILNVIFIKEISFFLI